MSTLSARNWPQKLNTMQKFKLNQIVAFKPFDKTYLGRVTHVEETLGSEPRYHLDSPNAKAKYIPESRLDCGVVFMVSDNVVEEVDVTNIITCVNCGEVAYETYLGLLDPNKVYTDVSDAFKAKLLTQCDIVKVEGSDINYTLVSVEGCNVVLSADATNTITVPLHKTEPVYLPVYHFVNRKITYPFLDIVEARLLNIVGEVATILLGEDRVYVSCHVSRLFESYEDAERNILDSIKGL